MAERKAGPPRIYLAEIPDQYWREEFGKILGTTGKPFMFEPQNPIRSYQDMLSRIIDGELEKVNVLILGGNLAGDKVVKGMRLVVSAREANPEIKIIDFGINLPNGYSDAHLSKVNPGELRGVLDDLLKDHV